MNSKEFKEKRRVLWTVYAYGVAAGLLFGAVITKVFL